MEVREAEHTAESINEDEFRSKKDYNKDMIENRRKTAYDVIGSRIKQLTEQRLENSRAKDDSFYVKKKEPDKNDMFNLFDDENSTTAMTSAIFDPIEPTIDASNDAEDEAIDMFNFFDDENSTTSNLIATEPIESKTPFDILTMYNEIQEPVETNPFDSDQSVSTTGIESIFDMFDSRSKTQDRGRRHTYHGMYRTASDAQKSHGETVVQAPFATISKSNPTEPIESIKKELHTELYDRVANKIQILAQNQVVDQSKNINCSKIIGVEEEHNEEIHCVDKLKKDSLVDISTEKHSNDTFGLLETPLISPSSTNRTVVEDEESEAFHVNDKIFGTQTTVAEFKLDVLDVACQALKKIQMQQKPKKSDLNTVICMLQKEAELLKMHKTLSAQKRLQKEEQLKRRETHRKDISPSKARVKECAERRRQNEISQKQKQKEEKLRRRDEQRRDISPSRARIKACAQRRGDISPSKTQLKENRKKKSEAPPPAPVAEKKPQPKLVKKKSRVMIVPKEIKKPSPVVEPKMINNRYRQRRLPSIPRFQIARRKSSPCLPQKTASIKALKSETYEDTGTTLKNETSRELMQIMIDPQTRHPYYFDPVTGTTKWCDLNQSKLPGQIEENALDLLESPQDSPTEEDRTISGLELDLETIAFSHNLR